MLKQSTKEFAVVEFDDSCDESQTLIEVIPSKWLFDNNNKCKYPSKKDKLKTTRLVMSKIDPGQDWDIYNLQFHHYYSTYNTALKAAKTVLEGEVAQTEAETDYTQPRKRKKNRRYISSSSNDEEVDESLSNVPHGTSSEVPAPDSRLSNKLKVLFKNKSMKTSAICQQKETSVGKLFSRNESRVKFSSLLKSTNTSNKSPIQQHSSQNKVTQEKYLSPKDCNTQMSEKFVTAEPSQ